jgi:chlorite dismutase
MTNRLWHFGGGFAGGFRVLRASAIRGEPLPTVPFLAVSPTALPRTPKPAFHLKGVTSNERYTTREEKTELGFRQHSLGRPRSKLGALIPIKKSQAWWDLPQDERRAIFEERSQHVALGKRALPGVARRLHHCRDLGTDAPFDFLTWFDFAADTEPLFDELLGALRATEEWQYVEREVELRVERDDVG